MIEYKPLMVSALHRSGLSVCNANNGTVYSNAAPWNSGNLEEHTT